MMLNGLNLSEEDIIEVTGKRRPSAQIRVLRQLGFDIKIRPDGKPLLCREHYFQVMGAMKNKRDKTFEPNLEALNA